MKIEIESSSKSTAVSSASATYEALPSSPSSSSSSSSSSSVVVVVASDSPSPLLSRHVTSVPYIKFKLLYFLLFASYGAFQPYCPIYFESLKFTKAQVGILSMIPNMTSFFIGTT